MNNYKEIHPSILAFDLTSIDIELDKIKKLNISNIHYDFVAKDYANTPTSFIDDYIDLINNYGFNINIHIMAIDIEKYLNIFLKHNIKSICFQYEVTSKENVNNFLFKIKKNGIKAGIAVRPYDDNFFDLLHNSDFVLLMTVIPGKGGQKFLFDSVSYIKKVYDYIKLNNLNCYIVLDGGINLDTINYVLDYGDVFVSGTGFVCIPSDKQKKFLNVIKGE